MGIAHCITHRSRPIVTNNRCRWRYLYIETLQQVDLISLVPVSLWLWSDQLVILAMFLGVIRIMAQGAIIDQCYF
jgi:hypothetical protein